MPQSQSDFKRLSRQKARIERESKSKVDAEQKRERERLSADGTWNEIQLCSESVPRTFWKQIQTQTWCSGIVPGTIWKEIQTEKSHRFSDQRELNSQTRCIDRDRSRRKSIGM